MGRDDRALAALLALDARKAQQRAVRSQRKQSRAVKKAVKRRRQAREQLPGQLLVTAGGVASGLLLGLEAVGFSVAGVAALLAARSASVLLSPERPAPPQLTVPAVAPPPPVSSAAWPYVRRLEAVRVELARLLPLVASAGHEAAQEAWQAAASADGALRWQAARLAAVEPHRGAEPALVAALEDGVSDQESLVTAMADLVSASADPGARSRLQDAADRLHGLAEGLREVT